MLLLVLILVLVAFGLLVVALLSGSVLWAWVSVGVSVAAAAVLLVDWLQRRSAVRDGPENGPGAVADAPVPSFGYDADIDPITEVIPIIPSAGAPPHGPTGNGVAGGYPGNLPRAAFSDPRFDVVVDTQQTVAMPVLRPSGSTERPSGATTADIPSGGNSSQSVTVSGTEASEPGAEDERAAHVMSAATVTSAATTGRYDETGRYDQKPAGGTDRADEPYGHSFSGARIDTAATSDLHPESAPEADGDAAIVSPPADPDATTTSPSADTGLERTAGEAGPESAAAPDSEPTDSPEPVADADATVTVHTGGISGTEPPDPEPAPPDHAGLDPEATTVTVKVQDAVTAAHIPTLLPVGPDGEPPEEPRDAAAVALVAELLDEVVVVDERPRYHVPGCPSLLAKPVIPLPVGEAVELGFTPCGWCSPDRVLSDRHRTAAR